MTVSTTPTITIDCDFHFPRFAASYLIYSQGEAAFIDNNTRHCVPRLLSALSDQALKPADVKFVIITHVHLDHAGGTADLMAACPNAVLLAHPRATRHMIDPTRLIAGVRKVYGDAVFDKVYGEFAGIEPTRVRAMEDHETVNVGDRELEFIHTRGHANHHMCIYDRSTREIFTGDAFGVRYPDLQKGGLFIYPTTSPTEYDGKLAIEAIDKIVGTGATRAYPTHYGELDDMPAAAEILKADLLKCEEIVESARQLKTEAEISKHCERGVNELFKAKLAATNQSLSPEVKQLLAIDITLNAAGLAHAAMMRNAAELR